MTKIDIFSGFLGAGKTTLIKKMISECYKGQKLVLIENEFGEIGIDGGFMADAGINVTEMNSGCICCSLVGDFSEALQKVAAEYNPDRIVIEPSGVGKLSDVIKAVMNANLDNAKLNAFCTVVDASKCKMYMKNFGEFFNDQVQNASCIVLSHTAKSGYEKLRAAVNLLKEKNPNASFVTANWDDVSGADILATMEKKNSLQTDLDELSKQLEDSHHHDHHGHHHCDDPNCDCHEHDHHGHHHGHHADEVFVSWGAETARVFTADELAFALNELANEEKYGVILRAKGIVVGENAWLHFDYVPNEPDVREGRAGVTGRLCVIGCKLNEDALKELFKI